MLINKKIQNIILFYFSHQSGNIVTRFTNKRAGTLKIEYYEDSILFSRWFKTLGMTGIMDFVHRSEF